MMTGFDGKLVVLIIRLRLEKGGATLEGSSLRVCEGGECVWLVLLGS